LVVAHTTGIGLPLTGGARTRTPRPRLAVGRLTGIRLTLTSLAVPDLTCTWLILLARALACGTVAGCTCGRPSFFGLSLRHLAPFALVAAGAARACLTLVRLPRTAGIATFLARSGLLQSRGACAGTSRAGLARVRLTTTCLTLARLTLARLAASLTLRRLAGCPARRAAASARLTALFAAGLAVGTLT